MGIVSGEALLNGGKVVGVLPRAMVAGGGEGKKADSPKVCLNEVGREKVLSFAFFTVIAPLKLGLFIGRNRMCFFALMKALIILTNG